MLKQTILLLMWLLLCCLMFSKHNVNHVCCALQKECTGRLTACWQMDERPLWKTNRRCPSWKPSCMRFCVSATLSHSAFSEPPPRRRMSMATPFPKAPWWSPTCTQCTLMRSTGWIPASSHHRGSWTAMVTSWDVKPSCHSRWVSRLLGPNYDKLNFH